MEQDIGDSIAILVSHSAMRIENLMSIKKREA